MEKGVVCSMIVKDFLLSMDAQKLSDIYFDRYYKNNEISIAEAKLHNCNLASHIDGLVKHVLHQIASIECMTPPNKKIIVSSRVSLDSVEGFKMIKCHTMDVYYIDLNTVPDLGQLQHIKNIKDQLVEPLWISYGLTMTPWEDLLGYEIGYLPENQYAAAACILFEMTFWGYDQEQNFAKIQEVNSELDNIENELNNGDFWEYNDDEFRDKFNLPQLTPEQKEQEQRICHEIYVENYNITVDIYNKLQADGLFIKHT